MSDINDECAWRGDREYAELYAELQKKAEVLSPSWSAEADTVFEQWALLQPQEKQQFGNIDGFIEQFSSLQTEHFRQNLKQEVREEIQRIFGKIDELSVLADQFPKEYGELFTGETLMFFVHEHYHQFVDALSGTSE